MASFIFKDLGKQYKTNDKKECVTRMLHSLQNPTYTLSALHVVTQIHATSTCDFLLPSLSVSAISTPTLHDGLFCSPSRRTHVVPLNCNGAGKCICAWCPRKQNGTSNGKALPSLPTTHIFHSNSKIPWF